MKDVRETVLLGLNKPFTIRGRGRGWGSGIKRVPYLTSCTGHSWVLVSHQQRSDSRNKSSTQANCP